MIVLDTNVLSAITAENPDLRVVQWLDAQMPAEIRTCVISIFELWAGVEMLKPGRRRDGLAERTRILLEGPVGTQVLLFTEDAARAAAVLAGQRKHAGINIDHRDTMIAGICLAHGATLATRNVRHFADAGLTLINPWDEGAITAIVP